MYVWQLHTLASCTKPTKRLLKAVGFGMNLAQAEILFINCTHHICTFDCAVKRLCGWVGWGKSTMVVFKNQVWTTKRGVGGGKSRSFWRANG